MIASDRDPVTLTVKQWVLRGYIAFNLEKHREKYKALLLLVLGEW